jgi:hypothetical protein
MLWSAIDRRCEFAGYFGGKIDRDQARCVMTPPQRTHALVGAQVSPATKQFLRMRVYAVQE